MGAYTKKPFVRIMHIHANQRIIKNGEWVLTRRWALTRENTINDNHIVHDRIIAYTVDTTFTLYR